MHEANVTISSSREWIGNTHFMKQLDRFYDFPVNVYRENEDGSRVLIRTEASASA
ncbi:hypothetical protein [Streptomyces althioticus]|uniref:hypothetical protein n=1 Tax=Streptomyces althioticus TaxID=83380 RepID=UPI0033D837DC